MVRGELTDPAGANVQWTFGERTERPRARLTKWLFDFLLELKTRSLKFRNNLESENLESGTWHGMRHGIISE